MTEPDASPEATPERSAPKRRGKAKKRHTVGKVLLAHQPRAQVEVQVRRHGLPARTEHTITDVDRFLDELDRVAVQGYAVDDEEGELGVRCLAVPLSGPAPAGLRVDGHEVVTGTLPRRVERYVDVRGDAGDVDLLDDAPGGALPHPGLLGLMDAFEAEDASTAAEMRQILVDPEAGHVELAVTVREEAGAGQG